MKPYHYLFSDDIRGWIPLDAALVLTQLSRSQFAYEILKGMVRVGCALDGCAAFSRPVTSDSEVRLSGFYVLFPETAFRAITKGRAEVHGIWSVDMEWFELRGDADPPRTFDEALRYGVAPRRFPTVTDEHLLFNRADLEYYNLPAGTSERKTGTSRRKKKKTLSRVEAIKLLSDPNNMSRDRFIEAGGTRAQFDGLAPKLIDDRKRKQPQSGPPPKPQVSE